MERPNPYEAPGSALIPPAPEGITKLDRLIAARMLEMRERGGLRVGLYLRWLWIRLLLLFIYFGLSLALMIVLEVWPMFTFLLGLLIGLLAMHAAILRGHWQAWPFTLRTMDWEKVRRIAEGEDA